MSVNVSFSVIGFSKVCTNMIGPCFPRIIFNSPVASVINGPTTYKDRVDVISSFGFGCSCALVIWLYVRI